MNDIDTPAKAFGPVPHPLATALATALTGAHEPRVALLGYGSGRNVPVLVACGARVVVLESERERAREAVRRHPADTGVRVVDGRDLTAGDGKPFSAALSTHALLHGTVASISATIAALEVRLDRGAPFYLTLGTTSDPRFGSGTPAGPNAFAPLDGSEAGVVHAYFDEAGVRSVLRGFAIDELIDESAAETAGTWAHTRQEVATLHHWFIRARRA